MIKAALMTAVAVMMIGSIPVFAQTSAPALTVIEYDQCIDKPHATNADWQKCGMEFVRREEDGLNATWKRVYGNTSGQTKIDLLTEERAWIAFKDKSCRFYASDDWGREGSVLHFYTCRGGVIADRQHALEAYGSFFRQ
ncbi:MAG TPA: lysozyme inhibitor LprI family protein [Xanthobacteraceae bacterium]|nr:lysozyme inhibitor LprI family protein [Xanthobacteraceae bacterium]